MISALRQEMVGGIVLGRPQLDDVNAPKQLAMCSLTAQLEFIGLLLLLLDLER